MVLRVNLMINTEGVLNCYWYLMRKKEIKMLDGMRLFILLPN